MSGGDDESDGESDEVDPDEGDDSVVDDGDTQNPSAPGILPNEVRRMIMRKMVPTILISRE
jgi:hypothetical protein